MTSEQRRRAVEVMAQNMWPSCAARKDVPCHNPCLCEEQSERGITALLKIADVTMKEEG